MKVQNYLFAVSQSAQTNLRAILGKYDLDMLLSDREAINRELHGIIARTTHDWGVEVLSVEVKDVDLPDDLHTAMAREAEAGREAKALLIAAEAERQSHEAGRGGGDPQQESPGHADPLPPDGHRRGHRAELDPGHADPDRAAEPVRGAGRRPRQQPPGRAPAVSPPPALGSPGPEEGRSPTGQRPPWLVPLRPVEAGRAIPGLQ